MALQFADPLPVIVISSMKNLTVRSRSVRGPANIRIVPTRHFLINFQRSTFNLKSGRRPSPCFLTASLLNFQPAKAVSSRLTPLLHSYSLLLTPHSLLLNFQLLTCYFQLAEGRLLTPHSSLLIFQLLTCYFQLTETSELSIPIPIANLKSSRITHQYFGADS